MALKIHLRRQLRVRIKTNAVILLKYMGHSPSPPEMCSISTPMVDVVLFCERCTCQYKHVEIVCICRVFRAFGERAYRQSDSPLRFWGKWPTTRSSRKCQTCLMNKEANMWEKIETVPVLPSNILYRIQPF